MTACTTCGWAIANDVFKWVAAALFVVFLGPSFVNCPGRTSVSYHPLTGLDARSIKRLNGHQTQVSEVVRERGLVAARRATRAPVLPTG